MAIRTRHIEISDGVCWAILGLLFIAMTTIASIYSKNMEIKHKENMAQLGICEEKGEDDGE